MTEHRAAFSVGQVIEHKLFGYRGVILDVDPVFQLSDEWYDQVARSRPPKDQPWYHVLREGSPHMTYVAQRNLSPDATGKPIRHPLVDQFFGEFRDGRYSPAEHLN